MRSVLTLSIFLGDSIVAEPTYGCTFRGVPSWTMTEALNATTANSSNVCRR